MLTGADLTKLFYPLVRVMRPTEVPVVKLEPASLFTILQQADTRKRHTPRLRSGLRSLNSCQICLFIFVTRLPVKLGTAGVLQYPDGAVEWLFLRTGKQPPRLPVQSP